MTRGIGGFDNTTLASGGGTQAPATPLEDTVNRLPEATSKRLRELTPEFEQFGDRTPPPYNYLYSKIVKEYSNSRYAYKRYSELENCNSYTFIPWKIAPEYSEANHRAHSELLNNLDKYFKIKEEINDLLAGSRPGYLFPKFFI